MLDPVMPSNDPGFVKFPAVDGVPLNLTVSPVDLPWDVSDTFIIPDEAAIVSKGLGFNIVATAFSVLSGLAFNNDCGSPPCCLGWSYGCLDSYSETWTNIPFHSLTISLYGNSIPDLSDIAFACFPDAYAIIFLGNNF